MVSTPYFDVFYVHLATPHAGQFKQDFSGFLILDCSADSIVRSPEITFCLELHICYETILWTSYKTMVSQFIFHLAKQYTTGIHIRLGNDAARPVLSGCPDMKIILGSRRTTFLLLSIFLDS